jgi:hypothetical protein
MAEWWNKLQEWLRIIILGNGEGRSGSQATAGTANQLLSGNGRDHLRQFVGRQDANRHLPETWHARNDDRSPLARRTCRVSGHLNAREMQASAIAERNYMEAMAAGATGIDPASTRPRFDATKRPASRPTPRTRGDKQEVDMGGTENPPLTQVKQTQGSALPVVNTLTRDH